MSNLTRYEQETIFLYNQDEKTATIYTCNPSLIRKLDKYCETSDEIWQKCADDVSKTYVCPKKWLKVNMPQRLTEEQKAAKRASMQNINDSRRVR